MKQDEIFNEQSLRADIAKTWGEHGAHIEIFDRIISKQPSGVSDEEIVKQLHSNNWNIDEPFQEGAKWMRSKLSPQSDAVEVKPYQIINLIGTLRPTSDQKIDYDDAERVANLIINLFKNYTPNT